MTPEAFLAFARSLPEPMALTDERGRVVASNAAARDFVIPLRNGTSICDLSPDGPRLREWLAACRDARGLLKTTVPLRRDDGTLVDVRLEATSLANGDSDDAPDHPAAPVPVAGLGGAGAGAVARRDPLSRAVLERRARHLPLSRRRHHRRGQPGARRHARPRQPRLAGRRPPRRRHLRGAGRVPDAARSHPPRRPGPQRRRQLAAPRRRSAGGAAVGPLRDRRQPGRRDRAAGRGRHRTADPRSPARPHHQDGVDRPPRRRHRPRLQQPADGDPRLRRPDAGLAQRAGSDRPARAADPPLGRARQPADAAAPRLQPQAVPAAARHRPERRGRGEPARCCAG